MRVPIVWVIYLLFIEAALLLVVSNKAQSYPAIGSDFRTASWSCKLTVSRHLDRCILNPGHTQTQGADELWQMYLDARSSEDEAADDGD